MGNRLYPPSHLQTTNETIGVLSFKVVVCPKADSTYEKIKSNIEEVKARKGATIAITERSNDELETLCEYLS